MLGLLVLNRHHGLERQGRFADSFCLLLEQILCFVFLTGVNRAPFVHFESLGGCGALTGAARHLYATLLLRLVEVVDRARPH